MQSLYDELSEKLSRDPRLTRRGGARADIGLLLFNARDELRELWLAAERCQLSQGAENIGALALQSKNFARCTESGARRRASEQNIICLANLNRIEYIHYMATTIHLPVDLLSQIDKNARELGLSRNKFVQKACEEALARQAGSWPEGFFELSNDDQAFLTEATDEMERAIMANRRNRGASLL